MGGAGLRDEWVEAEAFESYVARAEEKTALWRSQYERARIPAAALERLAALEPHRLLVIAEDWCGDAANTVPLLARLAAESPSLELRIVGRDDHPALMDTHLTGESRSIPVAIVLDEDFRELGWWGPRPAPLQAWVLETGRSLSKPDRYREVRRWHARDRGATTLAEVLALLERVSGRATSPAERPGR